MLTAEKVLGNIIDVINVFIKGIVIYFLALMFNFWSYQDGNGRFCPIYCMLIFICAFEAFFLQKYLEKFFREKIAWVLVCVFIGANFLMSKGVGAGNNAFFIISLLPFIENAICRHKLKTEMGKAIQSQTGFAQAFRNYNCALSKKYGFILGLIALFTIIESDYPSADYPISSDSCTKIFYIWFVIYLSLIVLQKYVKMQYTESAKYYGNNIDFLKRQLKTDAIVLLFSLVVFLPIVFIVQYTIFVPLCMLIIRLCLGLLNAGLSVISENLMEKLLGLFNLTDATQVVKSEGATMMIKSGGDFNPVMLTIMIVVAVVVIVIAVAGLLQLYKVKGVCYKSEEEEASFASEEELKSFEVQEIITVKYNFPRNNNGTIRKYYYKYMNNKIKKSELKEALCSTPVELENKFTDHDDKETVRMLTENYEKVRYSREAANAESVNEMKRLYRKLQRKR